MTGAVHEAVAIVATALATTLFAGIGLAMALRGWGEYRKRYVAGAAVNLDAMYIAMPAQNLLYLSILLSALAGLVGALALGNALAAPVCAAPAFFLPRIALWRLRLRRDEIFGEQLIDALVNLSNSLRAGFSLPQGLELVHQEMPNPMSQEIRLACQELRLGVPLEEALQNLYRRMPLADVDLVVTAITIVRDVGGNLSEVFDNIAQTIRERHRIEGKIRALTAQGRLQAIVVSLIPFALGGAMMLVAPDFFRPMIERPAGWILFGVILVAEILGALWIRRIVRIDV